MTDVVDTSSLNMRHHNLLRNTSLKLIACIIGIALLNGFMSGKLQWIVTKVLPKVAVQKVFSCAGWEVASSDPIGRDVGFPAAAHLLFRWCHSNVLDARLIVVMPALCNKLS